MRTSKNSFLLQEKLYYLQIQKFQIYFLHLPINLLLFQKMTNLTVITTKNPAIVKFQFDTFITKGKNFEFKNIDETKPSPLAQKLFYFPFVKTIYISQNFIAIEKFSIVEWDDVKKEVAEKIIHFIEDGGQILTDEANKKMPISIYAETTPNPAVLKFVANKKLTPQPVECKNIEEAIAAPIATELFNFPFVKEVFIDDNYIAITKYNIVEWETITLEIRTFIKEYLEEQKPIINTEKLKQQTTNKSIDNDVFKKLDITSQQIINLLEEYVKPAVASDGGNIKFESYNPKSNEVYVILQGACSGCPSSTFTLKNGIENLLREFLKDNTLVVKAING